MYKFVLKALFVCLLAFAAMKPEKALADAQFCNNTQFNVSISIRDVVGSPGYFVPETFGWLSVNAGQ